MLDADPAQLHRTTVRGNIRAAEDIAAATAHANQSTASQFLSAYDRLRNASSAARQAIFADPRTAIILERAANLVICRDASANEQNSLDEIIRDFVVLALSSALLDGVSWRSAGRVRIQGSFVLPGTLYRVRLPVRTDHSELSISSARMISANGDDIPLEEIYHAGAHQLVFSEAALSP